MESLDYWCLCDELSVIQAALLVAGREPSSDAEYKAEKAVQKPIGYEAARAAISNALRRLNGRGLKSGFFFPKKTVAQDYLDPKHRRYAPKLAAAVFAWLAADSESATKGKSPKQALMKWLREHATEFGMTDDDGKPNETGIEEVPQAREARTQDNCMARGGHPRPCRSLRALGVANRRHNARRVKRLRSYNVREAAKVTDATPGTVYHWHKSGLEGVKGVYPPIFRGVDIIAFLKRRDEGLKQLCGPGRMFCFRCKEPKTPAFGDATIATTLKHLRTFFLWLSREPGFRSAINPNDANYFTPSEQDIRVATARREKRVPTLQEIKRVLAPMPAETVIERRIERSSLSRSLQAPVTAPWRRFV